MWDSSSISLLGHDRYPKFQIERSVASSAFWRGLVHRNFTLWNGFAEQYDEFKLIKRNHVSGQAQKLSNSKKARHRKFSFARIPVWILWRSRRFVRKVNGLHFHILFHMITLLTIGIWFQMHRSLIRKSTKSKSAIGAQIIR